MGITSGVSCLPAEFYHKINQRQRALYIGFNTGAGVPVEADIQIIKHARTSHVEFAKVLFLGWGTVEADRATQFTLGNQFFDRYGCSQATRTKQVVPAAVASTPFFNRCFFGRNILR